MKDSIFDNLRKISLHNRQRIIELIGLDFEYQQLMIARYCELKTREQLAEEWGFSVETIDKKLTKAKENFTTILQNEYNLFTKEQQEFLDLLNK